MGILGEDMSVSVVIAPSNGPRLSGAERVIPQMPLSDNLLAKSRYRQVCFTPPSKQPVHAQGALTRIVGEGEDAGVVFDLG